MLAHQFWSVDFYRQGTASALQYTDALVTLNSLQKKSPWPESIDFKA
jgi:hypothetical protein